MQLLQLNKNTLIIIVAIFVTAVFFTWGDITIPVLNRNVDALVQKGNYYFNVNGAGIYDLERAEKYFEKALDVDANVPDAWHQLARIDFLRGDFDEALEKINTQIAIHGDSLMSSFYIRGLILGYMGRYEESEKDFLKFLEWDPTNWAAHNDLAWVYFSEGRFEDAADAAQEGLQNNPQNPWLLNMYGVSLMNLGDDIGAKNALQKAYAAAELLTESTWHWAYPGNNPMSATKGLKEFQEAIRKNLQLVGGN
ncbi:tetratricopeptide repeat protein [Candidatus Kaiserbacteria bacterium]|nr:tetratricopeptide repeat protein [Candidatus Kaiserbacteria bacterium]